ncbi:hypothetical protein [Blastococcus sp. PRF04-17]|uniref:hypothetical protein n=1 Tax=Blastococcus sp. PRF04-17 TaxID=2933797 RepID=UPI001FF31562|nr:hypothetical protein [Blastococcus sp. PRF04-17]UOY00524.1 hypothetical protein MVA48_16165 [Blastococcus sp. PRF04-17]
MSSWASVLDQLAALDPAEFDPDSLSDEQVREVIPRTQLAINRLSALMTRAVAAGEARQVHTGDGMVSMKTWLTGHCRVSGREAVGLVRAGRRLRQLPELAAAYAEGAVTRAHVDAVTTAVTPARVAKAAEAGIDLAETDEILADAARALLPEETAQAVRRWVHGIDPTVTSTTTPACVVSSGWPARPAAASTPPATSTPWAPRPCTPHWKR